MEGNGPVTWAEWDAAGITYGDLIRARFAWVMLGDRDAFDRLMALKKRPLGKEDA